MNFLDVATRNSLLSGQTHLNLVVNYKLRVDFFYALSFPRRRESQTQHADRLTFVIRKKIFLMNFFRFQKKIITLQKKVRYHTPAYNGWYIYAA
jgi:hypothetical protein